MYNIDVTINKDFWDYTLIIAPIILSLVAIIYSAISIKEQKKQWLNEYNIKRESEVLIKFKDVYTKAKDSIQFAFYLLSIQRIENNNTGYEPQAIEQEEIFKNYDKILAIYKAYKEEQYICKKHGIDNCIIYIQAILDFMQAMTSSADRNWTCIKYEDGSSEFKIINRDFYKNIFCQRFKNNKQNMLFQDNFEDNFETSEIEFENYRDIALDNLYKLYFKLEELTIYIDKRPKSFDYITENYYPTTDTLRSRANGDYTKNEFV